jgi:predicted aconitase with swiveling domain
MKIYGQSVVAGDVDGELLITRKPLLFNWVDMDTAIVNQADSELNGKCLTGKVLIVPCFKANIDMWRYAALCKKNLGPAAILTSQIADDYMIVGSILTKTPLIHLIDAGKLESLRDLQKVTIRGNAVILSNA